MSVSANTAAFSELAAKIRASKSAAGRIVSEKLKAAANTVVGEAQHRTEYSGRIPITVSSVTTKRARITTTGGGASKQDAIGAVIENWGKGNVRHPIFGNRKKWTAKNSHPEFMNASLRAKERETHDLITSSLIEAFREVDL